MKRFSALAMICALGLASACDDSPTEPDNTVVFTANLTAANEVPAVTGPEITTTGNVTITFNLTRGAGNAISSATANFSATLSNMPAGTTLILAHIHTGVAGVAGPFVVNTGLTAATAIPAVNGSATLTFNNIPIPDPATAQSIIDNPAAFYFNVHSTANPGGIARGQLVRQGS